MSNLLSDVFIETLNNQCFLEFPSGNGSWNLGSDFGEDGNLITKEELLDLISTKTSPWKADNEYSNEIILIKNELIKYNGLRPKKFIMKRLKTLRLVDKNIVSVDYIFKTMLNVCELILSANYISSIDAECLPEKLTVLELYSNRIDSLAFCSQKNMPPLKHLGIGRNKIFDISQLASSILSISLVSLDLGKNQLTDLSSTVLFISQLKSIKNLILAGNPLSLLAIYRGFVVDSIESLSCLDDIIISADERFAVKKMKVIPDSMKRLCKLKVSIPSINNIPEKEASENIPEEPVIKTEYYVSFWFPFQQNDENKVQVSKDDETMESDERDVCETDDYDIIHLHKSQCFPRLNPEIMLNWIEDIDINNVGKFCQFLDEPFRIAIMEETKYLYSPENLPSKAPSRMESQNSKRRGQVKSASKHLSNDANKGKKDTGKKKKIDESKLILYSKNIRKLTEYSVDISHFKDGETKFDQLLKADIIPLSNIIESEDKEKKIRDPKIKKSSAKDRAKSPEKSNSKKGDKTAITINPESSTLKDIECHLILNLLIIKNSKSVENP